MTERDLPPPMTPPDADLTGIEYYPMEGALFTSEEWMMACPEAQALILPFRWHAFSAGRPAGSLPSAEMMLARIAGYGRDLKGWARIRDQVLAGWVLCSDGRLYHPEVAARVLAVLAGREAAAAGQARPAAVKGGHAHRQQAYRDRANTVRQQLLGRGVKVPAGMALRDMQVMLDRVTGGAGDGRGDGRGDGGRDGGGDASRDGPGVTHDGNRDAERDASGVTTVTHKVEEEGRGKGDKPNQNLPYLEKAAAQQSVTQRHAASPGLRCAEVEIVDLAVRALNAARLSRDVTAADRLTVKLWLDWHWHPDRVVEAIQAKACRDSYTPPTALSYFEGPISDAIAATAKGPPAPSTKGGAAPKRDNRLRRPSDYTDEQWREVLRRWMRGGCRIDLWNYREGAAPGYGGCLVPGAVRIEPEFAALPWGA